MKDKKAGRIIILAAFILLVCFSKGVWIMFGKYFDSTNYENRELASKPEFTTENYLNFSSEYTDYVNDHLQFRNYLISLNADIDCFVFKKSSNNDVIVGNDNWLFYSSVADGDPVACYQGTNLLTEEELEAIAHNCINQRDLLAEQGKEFVIFIAPNKERIYSEYMPKHYGEPAENYRALQIYNYLIENTDIRVVYPYEDLMNAKKILHENIYYKADTHWNSIGAYIGTYALMDELGIYMPSIYNNEISINVLCSAECIDLANMLNLRHYMFFGDNEYIVEGYNRHDCKELEYEYGLYRYQSINADERSLFLIRDSFATAMAPYIGSQFNDSYMIHWDTYSSEDLSEYGPDIVVVETVERYASERLLTFSIQ